MANKQQIEDFAKTFFKQAESLLKDKAPVSGKVYDYKEVANIIEAALDGWWTEGRWSEMFENKIKSFLGIEYCLLINSGSSANFLALKILSSPKLKERQIRPGDEIITTACGFPTTVNAILDIGALPVFVDVDLETFNAKLNSLEKTITEKTKAIFLAHTLGNPFKAEAVKVLCNKHKLWLIEDNCDAFGSKYNNKYTGTFGDLATLSFYPAHHITTGEGGAVLTNNALLAKIGRSIRDWGRDCWCPTGKDDTCSQRFNQQLGLLPFGYDHKYTYSEIGYNLKTTDLNSAIGVAQMEKVDGFNQKRKENFAYLFAKMKELEDYFILPQATENSEPCWFGFLLTIKDNKINRAEFLKFLNANGVGTRLLFGGNLIKQPYFIANNIKYKLAEDLKNTDIIMEKSFWVGVYPRLNKENLDHIFTTIKKYINQDEI